MAIAIDPGSVTFIETTRLPSGRFGDRMLCEIGSTLQGLLYLHEILNALIPPDFLRCHYRLMIERFLSRPDRMAVLSVAVNRKQKR